MTEVEGRQSPRSPDSIGIFPIRVKKVVRMAETCNVPRSHASTSRKELDVEAGEATFSSLNINAGEMDTSITCDGLSFQGDNFFSAGDIILTEAQVGDGEGLALYRSARFGDFSYKFGDIEAGDYLVDLHFAEIVFVDGPPGLRVFDVYIQDEKVISGLDIYKEVGPNQPLILSDLKSSVMGKEGLSILFEGVMGKAIICGISIRSDSNSSKKNLGQPAGNTVLIAARNMEEQELNLGKCDDCKKLKHKYEMLLKEQFEVKRTLENTKQESELKGRECHEAWSTLQDLRMELMRKSMHVGSLAFAVEGQVKEKSRWLSSIKDLSEKLELMKLEHGKLSEEAASITRSCLEDMSHMADAIKTTADSYAKIERKHEVLKLKLIEEAKERKELYNKVVELKGNIRVFCRCRPLNSTEIDEGASMAIEFECAKDGELSVKASHGTHKKVFKFDGVFSPEEDQEKVFESTSPLATSVLDGYNACIFAYGQTGTGKTFTMEGTENDRGVNYRTLAELFRIIEERNLEYRYELTVSVMEVYNEQINDLLSGSQPSVASKRLEVRQVSSGVHHVPGLVEARVNDMAEVWDVLQTGSKARAVGSTNANEHSSRSHCIHCVMVRGENLMTGECTRSKLWLIDLAGSERVAKTDAQGERLKEAQSINRSLSALGDVISALATKSQHVPFRNSKLTHLLQDSLGGDSKTLMFVQISPNDSDVGETLCSLNFASRVRGIELGPARKQIDASEIFRYKNMVEKTKQDNKSKDFQIKKMEETINALEMKNRARDQMNKNLQDKVKELESQLLVERKLARQHVDNKLAEHQLLQQEQESTRLLHTPLLARPMAETIEDQTSVQESIFKELGNVMMQPPPSAENTTKPMPPILRNNAIQSYHPLPKDKENRTEPPEEEILGKNNSRVSLCNVARRVPAPPAPRRCSLIPFPTARPLDTTPSNCDTLFPPPLQASCPPRKLPGSAFGSESRGHEARASTKKLASILRRSLQKKVIIRPPLPHTNRRGGCGGGGAATMAGIEKLRVSIGGNIIRKAQRIPINDGSKGGDKVGVHLKRQQKDKERGWL